MVEKFSRTSWSRPSPSRLTLCAQSLNFFGDLGPVLGDPSLCPSCRGGPRRWPRQERPLSWLVVVVVGAHPPDFWGSRADNRREAQMQRSPALLSRHPPEGQSTTSPRVNQYFVPFIWGCIESHGIHPPHFLYPFSNQ